MKKQEKTRDKYLNMSDAGLKERLEEIRTTLYENNVRWLDRMILSVGELKKLRADAYEIQRIMIDLGISFSPIKVENTAMFNFLFSLIDLRSTCSNSCHSCR